MQIILPLLFWTGIKCNIEQIVHWTQNNIYGVVPFSKMFQRFSFLGNKIECKLKDC